MLEDERPMHIRCEWWPQDDEVTYLKVWADFDSSGLHSNLGARMGSQGSPIPLELWAELERWVWEYSPIWNMHQSKRDEENEKWVALDAQGIVFAKRIASIVGSDFPVYYFSEYRFKYLWPDEPPREEWQQSQN